MESSHLISPDKKQDRRVSRTKRNINAAFLELVKKKEISKITIKELCELADINRKTFYTYFGSVTDVLSEIENQMIHEFQSRIEKLKKVKVHITVADIIQCIGDLLSANSQFVHQLVQVDALDGLERKVKNVIKDAMQSVLAPQYTSPSELVGLTLEYIISGVVSMYIEWFSTTNSLPLKALTDMTVGLVKSNTDYMYTLSGRQ